jgi:ketosteroid isomerase-like protein
VLAWHAALNDGDVQRLLDLSTVDVEVGGPRGVGRGADLLRDWVDRAQIHLEPGRLVHDGATVVVEETAAWRAAESGQVGSSQPVATVFSVVDGRVARAVRYPDLEAALQAAGVSAARDG